ncbi:ferritin-like domain-containing protein [Actinomadura opuntiae]|uniref:ferritin-like domain-containing protein n=1 Tax=Actinomadura sp. OS1-43 TaxID=604315 RepID=UPI00255A9FD3|nr:ferritin-like domain-containing protein [Actinomadura sp. OS1-43]MDL4818545.1 ferritin-like domain-containing protein [Actinomadura sp. OS1-43]
MSRDQVDARLLAELTEQSQDLDSDAVRITREALGQFAEDARERNARKARRRSRFGAVGALAGAGTLWGAGEAAAASADVMALQTAASIENLAVAVYTTAAGLPFIKNGNKTIVAFIAKTTQQHKAHAAAFNSAAKHAGGKQQNAPDPKYAAVVKKAEPGLKTPADVVKLAITLEDVAAQTYTKNVSQVSNAHLRQLFGSIAPVEAQHRSVLLAVQALLAGNASQLIAIPTDAAKLPAAAGSVGIPDTYYPTSKASPISEGAVK